MLEREGECIWFCVEGEHVFAILERRHGGSKTRYSRGQVRRKECAQLQGRRCQRTRNLEWQEEEKESRKSTLVFCYLSDKAPILQVAAGPPAGERLGEDAAVRSRPSRKAISTPIGWPGLSFHHHSPDNPTKRIRGSLNGASHSMRYPGCLQIADTLARRYRLAGGTYLSGFWGIASDTWAELLAKMQCRMALVRRICRCKEPR